MKNKRSVKLLVMLLVGMLLLTACGGSQEPVAEPPTEESAEESVTDETEVTESGTNYEPMNIILAHQAPLDDPRHLGSLAFKDYIEKETNGVITVDVFPSGQLGPGRETVEATQGGAIHINVIPPAYMGGFQNLMTLLDIPYFLPSDPDAARTIIDGPAGEALLATLDEANLVGLSLWDSHYKQFTSKGKPLRTTDDFKGMKFRVMPSDILLAMIGALGGDAVTFDYSEVFTALQTGAIDGQEASLTSIYNMKFHEVQDYLTMTYHIKSEFLMIGSKPWFDTLSPEVQELVREAAKVGAAANNAAKRDQEEAAGEKMVEEGITRVDLTPEEIQGLKDAALQPCLDIYLNSNGERGQELVDLFMEEMAKLQ